MRFPCDFIKLVIVVIFNDIPKFSFTENIQYRYDSKSLDSKYLNFKTREIGYGIHTSTTFVFGNVNKIHWIRI